MSVTVRFPRRSLDVRVRFKGVDVFDAAGFESAHFMHSSSPVVTLALKVRR